MKKYLLIIILAASLLIAGWYAAKSKFGPVISTKGKRIEVGQPVAITAVDFQMVGNIVNRDNQWILVYEEPGKPALMAALRFADDCRYHFSKGNKSPCISADWREGERVRVIGLKDNEIVIVKSIDSVKDNWDIIVEAIGNCEVKMVSQGHDLSVVARLKNGEELNALEPKIDEIIDIAVSMEKKCGRIIMATE